MMLQSSRRGILISMMRGKTVLVVGAGASKEFGLPVGDELRDRLARLIRFEFKDGLNMNAGDPAIYDAFRRHVDRAGGGSGDPNPLLRAAAALRQALPLAISIDNVMDAHRSNAELQLCGKLAICRAILSEEHASSIYVDPQRPDGAIDFSKVGDTWLAHFFKLLSQDCRVENLESRLRSLAFIVFNYDRCIEHYLWHALKRYYQISDQDAARLVQALEIYHPYGTVGSLPWQSGDQRIGFGNEASGPQLIRLAQQIKTFTEGTDPASSEIAQIRTRLIEADRVVFLGFAFHPMNMRLLASEGRTHLNGGIRYFATAFGISQADASVVRQDLYALAHCNTIDVAIDTTCAALFKTYWRTFQLQ